jgi:Uma2 family endonuclease
MALEQGQRLLSFADYMTLPDEPRGEVLDGVFVVTPSPDSRHQTLAFELAYAIRRWLEAHPEAGRVFVAPLDVVLRSERPAVVVQPDLLFVSAERASIVQKQVHGAPDLVVEVVSPGSAGRDAVSKRDAYVRYGFREFWLVWPEEFRIDVFRGDGPGGFGPASTLGEGEALTSPLLPGFSLPLATLWGR